MQQQVKKPRRGDLLEVEIARLDRRGRGVGRAQHETGSYRVAVRGALPGARIVADVGKRRGERIEARLDRVLEPSPLAVPARCSHTASCGGCSFQELGYERQLEELHRLVCEAVEEAGVAPELVDPVIACESPWHYRNKMDFTFGTRRWVEDASERTAADDDTVALGLHVPGRHDRILDVTSCAIHFAEADGLLSTVRGLVRERGLSVWDLERHEGLLRHLVLRKGVNTGEIMVFLVTSAEAPAEVVPLCEELVRRHPEVTTVVQGVHARKATVAAADTELVLYGPGTITEQLCGRTFEISATSFFQTNTRQAERLFEVVREEAALAPGETLFDLYCGAGTIGLTLAQESNRVIGLESVPSAVRDARRNAARNGLAEEHASFSCGDVLELLAAPEAEDHPRPDVVVVDPPRVGLHPKVVPALTALAPERLVYVSCNPLAAARDLASLRMGGYRVRSARPVDMFPHTPHVECVFGLERGCTGFDTAGEPARAPGREADPS